MIRLRHMLESAETAVKFIENKDRSALDNDEMLRFALARAIEIIGEAATNVSPEGKATCKDLPWTEIVGMRNRIVHAYFDVNLDILWATITKDLPTLILRLKKIVKTHIV